MLHHCWHGYESVAVHRSSCPLAIDNATAAYIWYCCIAGQYAHAVRLGVQAHHVAHGFHDVSKRFYAGELVYNVANNRTVISIKPDLLALEEQVAFQ
jgi:hypothetical protein